MQNSDRFRWNEPQVVGEVLDGEFVVIHFETGNYYGIRDTGAEICERLASGQSVGQIVEAIASSPTTDRAQVEREVRAFVEQLVSEQLLVAANDRPISTATVELRSRDYSTPRFEKYDDMANQLVLDPIHDLDAGGWPVRHAA